MNMDEFKKGDILEFKWIRGPNEESTDIKVYAGEMIAFSEFKHVKVIGYTKEVATRKDILKETINKLITPILKKDLFRELDL